MKKVLTLLLLIGSLGLMAAPANKYVGTTATDVIGKHEQCANLTLVVTGKGPTYQAHLNNFKILNYKGISISGTITLSAEGRIIGYKDLEITGVKAKVQSLSGTLTASGADLTLTGKAYGVAKFTVRYTGKP